MKELSIEENAKAYTELINRLEDVKDAIKKQNYGIAMDILYKPYPEFQITTSTELKELEDERIRKALIEGFKVMKDGSYGECTFSNYNIPVTAIIAWLEKQKNREAKLIISDEGYNKAIQDGIEEVLTNPHKYGLEKQGEHQKFRDSIQVGDKVTRNEDGVLVNLSQLKRVAKPVEPMIVGQEPLYDYTNANICQKDFAEQKPAWSEEDEKFLDGIIANLEYLMDRANSDTLKQSFQKRIEWLKSLKGRVQPKQEWSEENERITDKIFVIAYDALERGKISTDENSKICGWLVRQKTRYGYKPTKEQMDILCKVSTYGVLASSVRDILQSLYNDLKKLKE